MDFKRNIFWIILGVVLVGAIGGYFTMISGVKAGDKDLSSLKNDYDKKSKEIDTLAKQAADTSVPDAIKTPEHVKLAGEYKSRIDNQIKAIQESWKTRKFEVRFTDAPADSATKFDTWLGELRTKLTDQAAKASLTLPADADAMMFKEPTTDENSPEVRRHRDFRLRQMAVVEELISLMCKKYGKQQIFKFEPEKDVPERLETVETGVVALERVSISPPKATLGSGGASKATGLTGTAATPLVSSEERLKAWMEDSVRRSGKAAASASTIKAAPAAELPYSITSIDVQFVAPLANVPAVVQAIENSQRFGAVVVSRIDYQRVLPSPFPTSDMKLTTAGPLPMANTHYQEAPVRALVSFDIYEYDAAKEASAKAKAEEKPADKTTDKKKK